MKIFIPVSDKNIYNFLQFNIPFRSKKSVKNLIFNIPFCLFLLHRINFIRLKGQRDEIHVRLKFEGTRFYYDLK